MAENVLSHANSNEGQTAERMLPHEASVQGFLTCNFTCNDPGFAVLPRT
jgi:hypothetical protein